MPKITPHVGFAPGSTGNPLGDFLASQEKVQRFDVHLVLPAHGGQFADHRHRAQQIIQHRVRLRDILDIARRGRLDTPTTSRGAPAFDSDSPLLPVPRHVRDPGYLEYLRHAGAVVSAEARRTDLLVGDLSPAPHRAG
ncbi:MAG: hypothetical protein U0802_16265 [Candidatus Binatia bacterium]